MTCAVCRHTSFQFLFHHHHNWQVQRCLNCQLVQVVPLPSAKEVASLYHDDMDHFGPYLAQINVHRAYFREKIKRIAVSCQLSAVSLLDIGCALGVLLEEAQKVGWKAIGIDYSKDAVEYCRKIGLNAYHGTVASFKRPGLLKLKLFDVITACEVIEHERDPLNMVRAMYQLLEPGGIAVITTPNHNGWWRRVMGKWWPGYQHPEHLFFFDPESITYLLKHVGFSSVDVVKDPPRPFPFSFLFTRAADYFPLFKLPLLAIGKLLDAVSAGRQGLKLTNPISPWDGMMVVGRK